MTPADTASAPAPTSEAPDDGGPVTLSVDAMGGDHGAETVLDGLSLALDSDPALQFLLHGERERLATLLAARPALAQACETVPSDSVVPMDARPSQALRSGRRSSMWLALDSLAAGRAQAALSAGNTGALMTMATVRLRTAKGVGRPAIAALWPSLNPAERNVVLDVGADLKADAGNLVEYALMGAEYARIALDLDRPRAALLNVGVEDGKGPSALHAAAERLEALAGAAGFDFVGFVEGDRIASPDADVIVTDGFTGNVALKTAEGTARLVGGFLRDALGDSWAAKLGAALAKPALGRFKRRIDPRRVNGGVFLGLSGVVVKSHGAADAVGIAAAAALAARMGRRDIAGRIAAQVANFGPSGDDAESGAGQTHGRRAGGETSGLATGSA